MKKRFLQSTLLILMTFYFTLLGGAQHEQVRKTLLFKVDPGLVIRVKTTRLKTLERIQEWNSISKIVISKLEEISRFKRMQEVKLEANLFYSTSGNYLGQDSLPWKVRNMSVKAVDSERISVVYSYPGSIYSEFELIGYNTSISLQFSEMGKLELLKNINLDTLLLNAIMHLQGSRYLRSAIFELDNQKYEIQKKVLVGRSLDLPIESKLIVAPTANLSSKGLIPSANVEWLLCPRFSPRWSMGPSFESFYLPSANPFIDNIRKFTGGRFMIRSSNYVNQAIGFSLSYSPKGRDDFFKPHTYKVSADYYYKKLRASILLFNSTSGGTGQNPTLKKYGVSLSYNFGFIL